ncbi:MAG: glutamate--tRNA ligase [Chitinophagales bacterium]|nr:glutamate--tRNA ligase [Chitinophagales bacterium]MDW8393805.1 glutamate--tRNA ligase [Chitinophagales bacterium]
MESGVRVRFAPSPTGPLHIGGLRTALYNFLFARKHNGAFLLRIEDTDRNRLVPGAEQYILDSLRWCQLHYDEGPDIGGPCGPYRQSERLHLYRHYAQLLVERGHAYYAFDTAEQLEALRRELSQQGSDLQQYDATTRNRMINSLTLSADEVQQRIASGQPYVIRALIPQDEEIQFVDRIRGTISVHSRQLDDKVLFKSDGWPTYHLANVVDDHLMNITHVIRGEEWLSSTPLHVLLYRFFGWESQMPQFAHLPLLLKPEGTGKLSKRDGDRLGFPVFPLAWTDPETGQTSPGYRERGFLPEAVINFLALLGWHPSGNQELFELYELIHDFSLEHIHKSGARFDFEKARWFNHEYLKRLPGEEVARLWQQFPEFYPQGVSWDYLVQVCDLLKQRCSLLEEFRDAGRPFFERPVLPKEWVQQHDKGQVNLWLPELLQALDRQSDFSKTKLEELLKNFLAQHGLKAGAVLPALRLALLGVNQGPSVADIMAVLGKEEVSQRLQAALHVFTSIDNPKVNT